MQSASAIFNRVLTQNKIKRIRRDNPTGLWLEMKECLCSFLSEASVFPHSSDSGMSRWVGTCRQTAPRAPRSGRGARCVPPCLTLLFPSGFWVSGLRCQLHPCLGVAREPRRRSAARTRASTRGTLSRLLCVCGSGPGIQHRLRHPGTQAAPWGIYHLLRSTASATTSFSASICGAESQWRGRWTPRRYYLAA